MIKKLLALRRGQGDFASNVLTLMTGTTLAQAIPIAAMPILTRLYTPEQFGVLALYMAIVSILSVVVTARYELAVMLPERHEDAASLVALSAIVAAVISIVLLGVVHFLNHEIQLLLNNQEIGRWLYLVPVTVFVTGLWQSLNYWNNRNKQFRRLAYSRVTQGAGMTTAQFALSAMPGGGLIIGYFVGQLGALAVFFRKIWKEDREVFSTVSKYSLLKNASEYKKFPKYSSVGALLDSAALQMPILMLNKFFDTYVVGMFSLTFRALNLPVSLIAASISQVLFQKVVEINRKNPESLRGYILKLFCALLVLMLPAIVIVWFFGEDLFSLVFGEKWRQAGSFAAILIFAVAIRFAVSPLSSVMAMEHNVRMGTLWQIIYFITISVTLLVAKNFDAYVFVMIFVAHEIVLYGLYFAFILKGSRAS